VRIYGTGQDMDADAELAGAGEAVASTSSEINEESETNLKNVHGMV